MDVMKPPDKPWARLHVVRGAPLDHYQFVAERPVELSIGSAPCSHLFLPLPGVAPRQLELAWDGWSLWLQDPLRLGCTLVGGRPLNEWQLVRGEALIAFSSVRLWVAARLVPPLSASPDFAALESARHGRSAPSGARVENGRTASACRRSPTVRLPNQELTAEQLDHLLSGAAGS